MPGPAMFWTPPTSTHFWFFIANLAPESNRCILMQLIFASAITAGWCFAAGCNREESLQDHKTNREANCEKICQWRLISGVGEARGDDSHEPGESAYCLRGPAS